MADRLPLAIDDTNGRVQFADRFLDYIEVPSFSSTQHSAFHNGRPWAGTITYIPHTYGLEACQVTLNRRDAESPPT